MKKLLLMSACMAGLFASPASAAWTHIEDEDAFSEEVTHIAFGSSGDYGIGFRCSSADDLLLIYLTPEAVDDDAISVGNSVSPKLLIRVDREPALTLDAQVQKNMDGDLGAQSEDTTLSALAASISAASDRVAVALEVGGERFHTVDFDVRGSTKALNDLIEGCSLE